jgi:hypothetical protein
MSGMEDDVQRLFNMAVSGGKQESRAQSKKKDDTLPNEVDMRVQISHDGKALHVKSACGSEVDFETEVGVYALMMSTMAYNISLKSMHKCAECDSECCTKEEKYLCAFSNISNLAMEYASTHGLDPEKIAEGLEHLNSREEGED